MSVKPDRGALTVVAVMLGCCLGFKILWLAGGLGVVGAALGNPLVLGCAALIAVLGIGALVWRRRTRTPAGPETSEPDVAVPPSVAVPPAESIAEPSQHDVRA